MLAESAITTYDERLKYEIVVSFKTKPNIGRSFQIFAEQYLSNIVIRRLMLIAFIQQQERLQ